MGTYGRNFHFLQDPNLEDRLGRYTAGADILIGAPVVAGSTVDVQGQRACTLATAPVAPVKGKHGLLIWEVPSAYLPDRDPLMTRPSDVDTAPSGVDVQLCSGTYVRIRLTNTVASTFYGRAYTGRKMVGGIGIATPTLAVDDLITPGPGNDSGGYWQETSDPTLAWAIVTAVNNSTGELDAQLLF